MIFSICRLITLSDTGFQCVFLYRQNSPSCAYKRRLPPPYKPLRRASATLDAASVLMACPATYRVTERTILRTSFSPKAGRHRAWFSALNAARIAFELKPSRRSFPAILVSSSFRCPRIIGALSTCVSWVVAALGFSLAIPFRRLRHSAGKRANQISPRPRPGIQT